MTVPIFFQQVTWVLGQTVFHSLWQITLLFGLFKSFSFVFPAQGKLRYRMALLTMLATLLWSAHTLGTALERMPDFKQEQAFQLQAERSGALVASIKNMPATPAHTQAQESLNSRITTWLLQHVLLFEWLGALWYLGVVIYGFRLLGGYWLAQRLRHRHTAPANRELQALARYWGQKLGIRSAIDLLESPHVAEPLTLGFWKPIVLFPLGLHLQLTPEQTEALLIHELAHIRRLDYVVNLFQLLLDALFFYHPLFRLVSKEARVQREYCCDDIVLLHTTDQLLYARTLVELKLQQSLAKPAIAMAATGISAPFSARIMRLAGVAPQRAAFQSWILFPILTCFTLCFLPAHDNAGKTDNEPVVFNLVQPEMAKPVLAAKTVFAVSANPPAVPAALPAASDSAPDGQSAAIQLDKMNVLYIGVDNPVHIAVNGLRNDQWTVRLNGDGAIYGGNGNYIVNVTRPSQVYLEVYQGDKLITRQAYRVKRIPDPVPYFSGRLSSSTISKQDLKVNGFTVSAVYPNFDFATTCTITGCELTMLPPQSAPYEAISINGNVFSPAVVQQILQLPAGSKLYLDNIRCKCENDASERNLGGMFFKIQE